MLSVPFPGFVNLNAMDTVLHSSFASIEHDSGRRDSAVRARQLSSLSLFRTVVLAVLMVLILPHRCKAGAQQAEVAGSSVASLDAVGDSVSAGSASDLPDSPQAQTANPGAAEEKPALQTKRILGIIPNFRAVSTDQKLPPQTVKEKFVDATEDSFDYSSVFIPLVLAGYSMESN